MPARALGFATLLFAASAQVAQAEEPPITQQAPAPRLAGQWHLEQGPGTMRVTLAVHNEDAVGHDVLTRLGSDPGARLRATVEVAGERVALELQGEGDGVKIMTRRGPMPVYATVAAGESAAVGSWVFALPEGADPATLQLQATVRTGSESVEIRFAEGRTEA